MRLRLHDVLEFRIARAFVNGFLFDVDAMSFHRTSPEFATYMSPTYSIARGYRVWKKGGRESARESYLAGRGANDCPPRGGFDGQVRVSQLRQRRMGRVPQGSHVHR